MKDYYEIFPEKYDALPEELKTIVIESNPSKRDMMFLEPCIKEGFFKMESASEIIEFAYILLNGIMYKILNFDEKLPIQEYTATFLKYFTVFLIHKNVSKISIFE